MTTLTGLIVLVNDTNCIIKSLKGDVQVNETNLTLLLFIIYMCVRGIKCLSQARKVSGHVYMS
jgi:hypothetical protein